jgi:hypothetical protein
MALAIKNAPKGNINIWQNRPINTALGNLITRVKSATDNDSPRPNIIMPNATGNTMVDNALSCI